MWREGEDIEEEEEVDGEDDDYRDENSTGSWSKAEKTGARWGILRQAGTSSDPTDD